MLGLEMLSVFASIAEFFSAFICTFFIGFQMYRISGKKAKFLRCTLFCFINTLSAFFLPTVYLILYNFFGPFEEMAVRLFNLLAYFRNPLWMLVCNITAVKLLKLNKQDILGEAIMLFCYSQIFILLSSFLEPLAIYWSNNDINIIYYIFIIWQCILIIITVIINLLLSAYIKRNSNKFKASLDMNKKAYKKQAFITYTCVTAIWLGLSLAYSLCIPSTPAGYMIFFISLIILMTLIMFFSIKIRFQNNSIANVKAHNQALTESIEDFKETKHEFYNVLQVYQGYIKLKNYTGLEEFHNKHSAITLSASSEIDVHSKLSKNPALYGLILSEMEYAKKNGVNIYFFHLDGLIFIDMPQYDLCRVLGILLNNAVEHACLTEAKNVSVMLKPSNESEGMVIISNSVENTVDTTKIFIKGYSTKPNHQGRGLNDANKILSKYSGFSIIADCIEKTFTIYFKVILKPYSTRSEP